MKNIIKFIQEKLVITKDTQLKKEFFDNIDDLYDYFKDYIKTGSKSTVSGIWKNGADQDETKISFEVIDNNYNENLKKIFNSSKKVADLNNIVKNVFTELHLKNDYKFELKYYNAFYSWVFRVYEKKTKRMIAHISVIFAYGDGHVRFEIHNLYTDTLEVVERIGSIIISLTLNYTTEKYKF